FNQIGETAIRQKIAGEKERAFGVVPRQFAQYRLPAFGILMPGKNQRDFLCALRPPNNPAVTNLDPQALNRSSGFQLDPFAIIFLAFGKPGNSVQPALVKQLDHLEANRRICGIQNLRQRPPGPKAFPPSLLQPLLVAKLKIELATTRGKVGRPRPISPTLRRSELTIQPAQSACPTSCSPFCHPTEHKGPPLTPNPPQRKRGVRRQVRILKILSADRQQSLRGLAPLTQYTQRHARRCVRW